MGPTSGKDLHEQILATAKQLFIEQGYHGLSMRQIAEAVDVSKAALYYHFRDKEELFLAIVDAYLDEMGAALERIRGEGGGAREQLHALVTHIMAQPTEQRAVIRLASQEMGLLSAPARQELTNHYQEKFIDQIQAILQAGVARGELRPLNVSVSTWTLLGMMYPYFYPAHLGRSIPSVEIAEQILTIYLDGLGQPGH